MGLSSLEICAGAGGQALLPRRKKGGNRPRWSHRPASHSDPHAGFRRHPNRPPHRPTGITAMLMFDQLKS
ncbi:MAG: hypothetical protein JW384_03648 [Nitrosomonadaceae bacterium]|nr:hypothetical protein [Nitrosomonadaceae bacterium]